MFTAGLGAYFLLQRTGSKAVVSKFLWTRGLWLVLLDVTAVRLALTLGSGPFIINVLWGLGWAMVALAALIHLPTRVLTVISIAVIALHDLADPLTLPGLHDVGVFQLFGTTVIISYTLVPWFAVMSVGYCFGGVFTKHQKWIAPIGLFLMLAFIALRAANVYGDPVPRASGLLSFLNANKYPPSLAFLLMTFGPSLLILAAFQHIRFSEWNPLIVFGRVPLFYFLAHLFLAHLLVLLLAVARYGSTGWAVNPIIRQAPTGYGYGLGIVYLIWIAVVAALYPLCVWFMGVKQRRDDRWLRYL
jgi:uncharacterized membrane protein